MARDSYLLEGGAVGVLLLHGFTGDPSEMRPLAEHLHAQGYTVHAPLLPGHGSLPDALQGIPWQAWLRSAERAFGLLTERCQRVVVVGNSMGGALAVLVAVNRPVAGLVTLATPVWVTDWRAKLVPWFRPVMPYLYPFKFANWDDPMVQQQVLSFAPGADLSNPTIRQALGNSIRIPLGALVELKQLIDYTRQRAPFVSAPSLVLQGRHDPITSQADAYLLYGLLACERKELVWFEESGHFLLTDKEQTAVCQRVRQFIEGLA